MAAWAVVIDLRTIQGIAILDDICSGRARPTIVGIVAPTQP